MPQYLFRDDGSGREFWVSMTRHDYESVMASGGKRREKSRLNGKTITSTAVQMVDTGFHAIPAPGNWPMVSDAMSTHPKDAQAFNQVAASAGITGVYYDSNGDCHLSDRKARRQWMQVRGLRDNDGGYGDG